MQSNIGIYNLYMRTMGGGERLTLSPAEHLSANHNVWLFYPEPLQVSLLEQFFGLDLGRMRLVPLKPPGKLLGLTTRVRGWRVPDDTLHHYFQLRKLKLDLFINNSYASGLACPAARGIYMCMFPHSTAPRPSARSLPGGPVSPRRLGRATRDRLPRAERGRLLLDRRRHLPLPAEWVGKFWGRRTEVLLPPCEDMGPPAAAKRKLILHVGRFFTDAAGQEEAGRSTGDLQGDDCSPASRLGASLFQHAS
jgi:hypothetical protein